MKLYSQRETITAVPKTALNKTRQPSIGFEPAKAKVFKNEEFKFYYGSIKSPKKNDDPEDEPFKV